MGNMLPSISGWSASHSASDPGKTSETQNLTRLEMDSEQSAQLDVHLHSRANDSSTYCVHDRVGQHDVADVDSGDQADETGDDVRVVHVNRLGDGLEAK